MTKKERIIKLAKEWKSLDEIRIKSGASLGYIKTVIRKARDKGELPQPLLIKGLDRFDALDHIFDGLILPKDIKEEMAKLEAGEIREVAMEPIDKQWLEQIEQDHVGLQMMFNLLVHLFGINRKKLTRWYAHFSRKTSIDPTIYSMQHKDGKIVISKKDFEEEELE